MMKDVLPDSQESPDFRSAADRLAERAKDAATPQRQKFEDLARELEADEDPAHFEETLKKIATKTPPKDQAEGE